MRLVLVNSSQVCNHHITNRHGFGPSRIDLNNRKVLLLAPHNIRSILLVRLSWITSRRSLWPEKVRQVLWQVNHDWRRLVIKVATGAEPVDFLVRVHHHHRVGVTSSDLSYLLVVLLVDVQRSGGELGVVMVVAELPFVAGAPSVDLAET